MQRPPPRSVRFCDRPKRVRSVQKHRKYILFFRLSTSQWLSSLNITFDQSGMDQDKCSLHQSIRARCCFGAILGFLGAMYEVVFYCRRMRLIDEVLIDRLIFVLAYRTKSVKEFVSSRIRSSLMDRVCGIVVFFWRPVPGLVATVPHLSN